MELLETVRPSGWAIVHKHNRAVAWRDGRALIFEYRHAARFMLVAIDAPHLTLGKVTIRYAGRT